MGSIFRLYCRFDIFVRRDRRKDWLGNVLNYIVILRENELERIGFFE